MEGGVVSLNSVVEVGSGELPFVAVVAGAEDLHPLLVEFGHARIFFDREAWRAKPLG